MDPILYFGYIAAYAGLLMWAAKDLKSTKLRIASIALGLVLLGLLYDNTVVALGVWIGEGAVLEGLNRLRFWIHAFFTPLLVLFAYGSLRRGGIRWAGTKAAFIGAVSLTAFLIVLELMTETLGLKLQPVREYGLLRYESAENGGGPPLMVLFVITVLLIAGALLWRRTGWKWLCIGAVVMTIGSAVPIPLDSAAVTNGFELCLLVTLVATEKHQNRQMALKGESDG